MELEEKQIQESVVWARWERPDGGPEDRPQKVHVKEGCDVDDLTKNLKEQLEIPHRRGDLFLVLPEAADPQLGTYLAKEIGALDPQKELGPDFFKLLGKGILKVRVRPGAEPLLTQPPGLS
eukprot:m51a1_g1631 hypothetical protein (121) ;mRNA; r:274956-275318